MATTKSALTRVTTLTKITDAIWNKVVDVLDRIFYLHDTGFYGGNYTGWSLTTSKTITAGSGLVGGFWCVTAAAYDISSALTNNATNYIYATKDSTSPNSGTVTFSASISSACPAGSIRLGSMTVNSAGTVTATDDNPETYRRDYLPQTRWSHLEGTYSTTVVASSYVDITVDHSDERTFTIPFPPMFTSLTAGCRIELLFESYSASAFEIRLYNDAGTAYNGAVSFTWDRWGM